METQAFIVETLKIVASMVLPFIALLRTRTDLDRFAAAQRAKELGTSIDCQMRARWYHRFKGKRKIPMVTRPKKELGNQEK